MPKSIPTLLVALAGVTLASGCSGAAKTHLQYDHGRAFSAIMIAQADLTRPSVADLAHPLTGVEAQAIRLRVQEATTDQETGDATLQGNR